MAQKKVEKMSCSSKFLPGEGEEITRNRRCVCVCVCEREREIEREREEE